MADNGYSSAWLKVERAKHHIGDLELQATEFARDNASIHIETNPDTGLRSIKFASKPLGPEISLIFGDAVTNLRAALDHCCVAAMPEAKNPSKVYFPIRDARNDLVASVDNRLKEGSISQALADLIVDQIEPYDGGHPTLTALNKLANTDKHRLLLSVVSLVGVTTSFTAGGISFSEVPLAMKAGEEAIFGPVPMDFHSNPQPFIEVRIGETVPRIFHNAPVGPTLSGLADDVADVIRIISAAVPR